MKQLTIATLFAAAIFATSACAKQADQPAAPAVVAPVVVAKPAPAVEQPAKPAESKEMQTVCIDSVDRNGKPVIDAKTGKVKQECRKMRVHKKLEGTAVPPQKK